MPKTRELALAASSPRTQPFKHSKLNIGSGRAPKEGYVNCDLYDGDGVDYVFDCQKAWPFPDQSVSRIESDHVLEHLANPLAFFQEAYRVLIPNGQMCLRVPYGWNSAAWWDMTHLRPWIQQSFSSLQPGFFLYSRNHQEVEMGCAFWVVNVVMILERQFARMWRWKILRPLVAKLGNHLIGVYKELIVELYKTTPTDSRSKAFGGDTHPAVVPCSYAVWAHEYYGRSLGTNEEIIVFAGKEAE